MEGLNDSKTNIEQNLQKIDDRLLEVLYLENNDAGPLAKNIAKLQDLIPGMKSEDVISLENPPTKDQLRHPEKRYDERVMQGLDLPHSFTANIEIFLRDIADKDPERLKSLQEKFKDQTLIDIGAGEGFINYSSVGYKVALILRAGSYIGVEPFNWTNLASGFMKQNEVFGVVGENKNLDLTPIPFNLVCEDALTFLRRLPDNSVCLLSGGLDGDVINDKNHRQQIELEMLRVLKEGGAAIVVNSLRPDGLEGKDQGVVNMSMIRVYEK